MTTLTSILSGFFTSDGTRTTIVLPKPVDYFQITNRSIWGSNPADLVVQSFWYRGFAAGQAKTISESAAGVMSATLIVAGGAGFTELDESSFSDGAAVVITAITQAAGAVVSTGTTPVVGDFVRIINPTAMLEIGGQVFEVTAVNPGVAFTLGSLDSSGFAAPATGGSYRVVDRLVFQPPRNDITAITQAASAVVSTAVSHTYTVGGLVTMHVSTPFGMTQMDNLTARITAVTARTFTINIDSTTFTAFAYPTSAIAAAGVTHAHVVDFGEIATKLDNPLRNTSQFGMILGTGVSGSNTDVMDWQAFARDYTV